MYLVYLCTLYIHTSVYISILFTFSGAKNLEHYTRIGEIRLLLPQNKSLLLPQNINLVALTATANVQTRCVIKYLEMQSCYVLTKKPNMLNIRYDESIKPSDPLSIVQPFITSMQSGLKPMINISFSVPHTMT